MFLISSRFVYFDKRGDFCFKKKKWPTVLKASKKVTSIRMRTVKNKRPLDLAGGILITDPPENDFFK